MKRKKTSLIHPSDSRDVQDEINELVRLKYPVRRCTPHHLKIWDVNYYLNDKRRITIDPRLVHSDQGFEALLSLLERKRSAKKSLRQQDNIEICANDRVELFAENARGLGPYDD